MIGDPGGKTGERALLSPEELAANLEGVRPQLERFLDFSTGAGAARALLVDNARLARPLCRSSSSCATSASTSR